MEKGSGTRSGLLWEVERILSECKQLGDGHLPKICLMENVTQIHNMENNEHFKQWQLRLEELGYKSYWEDLSATDYGIPQTRNRTFMISILGDYNYNFPKRIPLKLRLKDLLEPEGTVDEKYYLSDKLLQCFLADGTGAYPRKERFLQNIGRENQDIANSITTLAGNRPTDNFVVNNKALIETLKNTKVDDLKDVNFVDSYNRKVKTDGKSITITTRIDGSNNNFLLIKNATSKGYLEATEGDGIDISSRMESHRGTVQKNKAQTITTMGGENVGVVVRQDIPNYSKYSLEKIKNNIVEDTCGCLTATGMQSITHDGCQLVREESSDKSVVVNLKRGYSCKISPEKEDSEEIDVIGNYSKSGFNQTSIVGKNGIAPTVTENHGQVTAIVEEQKNEG